MIREQLSFFPPFTVSLYAEPKTHDYRKLPKRGSRREAVLRQVINQGKRGVTDEELQEHLLLSPEQIHQARAELTEGGLIHDAIVRRNTRFGDAAIVWRVSDYGQQLWKDAERR